MIFLLMTNCASPPTRRCKGWRHGGQVFGDMVDGLTPAQLVPVVHRRDPRAAQRPPPSLAERSAGGACGPTGASVMVSRSRCRLAQIERADLVGAEQHVEAAILVARTQRDTA